MKKNVIHFAQSKISMYLTAFSVKELLLLESSKQLVVDVYDPTKKAGLIGYQRRIDESRANDISKFLTKKNPALQALLPGTVILNSRDGAGIKPNSSRDQVELTPTAELHVVDGQHRIGSLKYLNPIPDYEIPATIIVSLEAAQEASQFLAINSKQKRIRPDLTLRILYHQDRAHLRKLIDVLGVDNWKMEALTLCIALNDRNESPWRNLIKRPGEETGDRWTPLSEANFVDSLNYFCRGDHALKDVNIEEKEGFLVNYWESIRKNFSQGFSDSGKKGDSGREYLIAKGMGAGAFHYVAPLMFALSEAFDESIDELVSRAAKRFPLKEWRRKRGKVSSFGSSQSAYKAIAEAIAVSLHPGLSLVDSKAVDRALRKAGGRSNRKALEKSESLLSPLHLKPFEQFKEKQLKEFGCYVLISEQSNGKVSVYIGKSSNIKQRLKQHLKRKKIVLFAQRTCRSEAEMALMEMALFHLVKKDLNDNKVHPPKVEDCPYC